MNDDKIQSMLFPSKKRGFEGEFKTPGQHQKGSFSYACGYGSPECFMSPYSNMAGKGNQIMSQFDSENETGSTYASNIAASGRGKLEADVLSGPQKIGSF